MASGTAKMFGCPFCGFRINPSDDVCSRCGSKFVESTKFECPFCGELIDRGAKSCPVCHVNYTEFRERAEARGGDDSIDSLLTEIIRLESASIKRENKRLSCPECSWLLDGSEEKCPKCGHSFAEDVSYQCPVCGAEIRSDADKCPDCGAMFAPASVTEEERASEHEEASSALDEILTHADKESKATIESNEKLAMEQMERPIEQKTTSMFDRITTAMKPEPKQTEEAQRPEPSSEPEPVRVPEAVPEPTPEPRPEIVEPPSRAEAAPDEQMDTGTSEQVHKGQDVSPQETTSRPKKTRTRKLKSKPKSG
jgi:RNA polymerase subunit RPABC4/transcription elongation factor Spt4